MVVMMGVVTAAAAAVVMEEDVEFFLVRLEWMQRGQSRWSRWSRSILEDEVLCMCVGSFWFGL